MARFTDPNKWKDSWFRKLTPPQKLLWMYLVDQCDNAGFFEYDAEMFAFFTGMKLEHVEGAFKGLSRGLVGAKSGDGFHIKNFLRHQKNLPLNKDNNAHKQIIRLLEEKREAFESVVSELLGASEGLPSPTGKGKGKGSSKGKGKYTPEFEAFWTLYKVGSKAKALEAWQKQAPTEDERDAIIDCVPVYKSYCESADRSLKDGQGWLNGRFWETEWTHRVQGTKHVVSEAAKRGSSQGQSRYRI